ncbi:aldo/keto reductase [Solirubrobacter sp. CPCC 204708]|uniref:Aldo/keto reductase n=1 Tax=Solirubrobacter deserti TaxID=2282478 RepID=A0ABT4REN9_9ACTN|nr:aldo/keto reductase [Solirubrobacter deserti]MBE2318505.1 aldo/keto reductase [Solirubrobacter deserti]MDA0136963.1 aldo/keto reductase [Solirubrobacter deserti]
MPKSLQIPEIDLADGVRIPQFGLGVFQVPPDQTAENVAHALEVGYRHIDTARIYQNEAQVGQAVRASGISREELFITTKLWNSDQANPIDTLKGSLELLATDYVDLYLIHWPAPGRDTYVQAWKGLVEAQKQGLVRSIGVSNFQPEHLRAIIDATGVTPSVNQIELHPYLTQPGLRREHADRGIVTEAWSPLAQGMVLDDPVITEIAAAHDRTPAQVVLRWHVDIGNVVFPKSMTPSRIEENIDIFDFELSAEEVERIEGLDRGHRTGPDPDTFNG